MPPTYTLGPLLIDVFLLHILHAYLRKILHVDMSIKCYLVTLCVVQVTGSFRRPRSKSEDRSHKSRARTPGLQSNLNRSEVAVGRTNAPGLQSNLNRSEAAVGPTGAAVLGVSEDSGNSSLNTSTTDSRRSRKHNSAAPQTRKSELIKPNLGIVLIQ